MEANMSIDATVFAFPLKTNSLFANVSHARLSRVAGSCGRRWPQARERILSSLVDKQQASSFTEPEAALIEGIIESKGERPLCLYPAAQVFAKEVERAVQVLEELKGGSDPTNSRVIEGCWQLMFTTRPGTASPIQRTFVVVDSFSVFQEIQLQTVDPRVSNIVKFSETIGELQVEAAASVKDGKRILFQFGRAAFSFKFLPFKVPYPNPFRLLGNQAKGWLDATYLSQTGNVRISRGSKGRRKEPHQRLLAAIATGMGVTEDTDEIISQSRIEVKAELDILGDWQLLWSSQSEAETWFDMAAYGLQGSQVFNLLKLNLQLLNKLNQVGNLFDFLPGIKLRAIGNLE